LLPMFSNKMGANSFRQISKVSKIYCLRFVMCPLLAPVFQGFFVVAINGTNETQGRQ
jgi:hypothetical protein